MSPTDLAGAVDFIVSRATEPDLDRLFAAVRDRRSALRTVRSAGVTAGRTVRLKELSPRYLCDLVGVVERITGKRCTVRLDEASTNLLRFSAKRSDLMPGPSEKTFLLPGVPLVSCEPVTQSR